MMPQMMNAFESMNGRHCTREQARELLEDLRAAYLSLPSAERSLVSVVVRQVGIAQRGQEIE